MQFVIRDPFIGFRWPEVPMNDGRPPWERRENRVRKRLSTNKQHAVPAKKSKEKRRRK